MVHNNKVLSLEQKLAFLDIFNVHFRLLSGSVG